MNEVSKEVFGGKVRLTNSEQLQAAMHQSAQNDPRGGVDGASYMNFSGKRGVYEIGVDKRGCADEPFLVNVVGFEDGWVCWKDGTTKAKRMYPLGTPVPEPNFEEFGPFTKDGDGWHQAKTLVGKSLDNEEQVHFTINSVSGVSVMAALQREITERMRLGQPYWPVVLFSQESFKSKGFTNYKPVITIDGWLNDEQVVETLPALLADENAQIDLEELYAAAGSEEVAPPTRRVTQTKEQEAPPATEKVGRRRRSL